MNKNHNKELTKEEIVRKLENYCAYRERCESEVRQKLYQLAVVAEETEYFLQYLREHHFLNEDRFVAAFARGKFNIKGWGKQKIQQSLKAKNIDDKKIQYYIHQLDEGSYFLKLQDLLEKKSGKLKEEDSYKKRQKLIQFALQKGYESGLIYEALKTMDLH